MEVALKRRGVNLVEQRPSRWMVPRKLIFFGSTFQFSEFVIFFSEFRETIIKYMKVMKFEASGQNSAKTTKFV